MTFCALAFALGYHFRVVGECHVHDSTFVGGHRIKRSCPPARCRAGGILGDRVKLLGPPLLVTFDIDDDVGALFDLAVDEHSDDELEVAQRFSSPTDQQACVRTFNFENNRTITQIIQHVCFDLDVHCGDQVTQDFAGHFFQLIAVDYGAIDLFISLFLGHGGAAQFDGWLAQFCFVCRSATLR